MQSDLRLESDRNDAKLPGIRYVVHGASNAAEAAAILTNGFQYLEGQPMLSTNMVRAADWTTNSAKQKPPMGAGTVSGDAGAIVILEASQTVGYGVFTDAVINRDLKQVSGAPLRYAAARKQLAFYQVAQWQDRRRQLEEAATGGAGLAAQPPLMLPQAACLGAFQLAGGSAATIIQELGASALDLASMNLEDTARYLLNEVQAYQYANPTSLAEAIKRLVEGTVESVIMSRLRMLRWQGLAGMGYTFQEGNQPVQGMIARPADKQLAVIDEYAKKVAACSMLAGDLAWMKNYAHQALEVMRVEVTGSLLDV